MLTDDVPKASIDFFGLTVLEPVTVITNLVLTLVAFWAYKKILKIEDQKKTKPIKMWAYFFLCLSFASFLGMFTHGIYTNYWGQNFYTTLWVILNIFTATGLVFGELSTLRILGINNQVLNGFIFIKYIGAIGWLIAFQDLLVTKIHIGTGFIGLIILLALKGLKSLYRRWLTLGLLITIMAGVLQGQRLSIDPLWFNFNDIAHVLFCVSTLCVVTALSRITRMDITRNNR